MYLKLNKIEKDFNSYIILNDDHLHYLLNLDILNVLISF